MAKRGEKVVVVVAAVAVAVVAASTDHLQFLQHFGRLCCAGIHSLQLIPLSNLIFNSRKSFSEPPEADKIFFLRMWNRFGSIRFA